MWKVEKTAMSFLMKLRRCWRFLWFVAIWEQKSSAVNCFPAGCLKWDSHSCVWETLFITTRHYRGFTNNCTILLFYYYFNLTIVSLTIVSINRTPLIWVISDFCLNCLRDTGLFVKINISFYIYIWPET